MYRLIRFIFRYYFVFLFLILEAISFVLLVSFNPYQGSVFSNSMNQFRGGVFAALANIGQYVGLVEENDKLALQNKNLLYMQPSSYVLNDTAQHFLSDTVRLFEYLDARVISNSVQKRNNLIMLNKGQEDGVEKEMGVLGPEGIVGIVVGSSGNFALVMPVLHKAFLLSARISRNKQVGSLIWDGEDPRFATLSDIPGHVDIRQGDTVVSSGFSLIFPEGLLLGTVDSIATLPGQNYFELKVKLSTDFNALDHVFVIRNLHKDEQDSLLIENQELIDYE